MRKIYFLFISVLILMLGLMPTKVSAINGNLTITHIGTTQKPPMGDWLTGIGETGRGYTINTIDLAKQQTMARWSSHSTTSPSTAALN